MLPGDPALVSPRAKGRPSGEQVGCLEQRVESGPKIPWTWAIAEVFKIERGLIGPVESVLHQAPYGTGSGWSTWEESLSSEPRG